MKLGARSALLVALLGAALASGCGAGDEPGEAAAAPAPPLPVPEGPHETAVLELEEIGRIRIELLPEVAPLSVANFKKLAEEGFYDGTTFHRVIPGFMIQGGDPNTRNADPRDDGKGGPGYTIDDEFNGLTHGRGMVAMAHKGTPHSAGSQFFIVHRDTPRLDGDYTIFGRVVEGIEVVDAVTELEIDTYGRWGPRNRPHPQPARIATVRIEPPS